MKNLKAIRLSNGITQKELSEKLGVTQQAISLYESENRQADYDTLKLFADYFKCTIDYLVGRVDEPNLVHYEIPNAEGMQIAIDIVEDALKEGLTPEDIKKFVALAKEMKNSSNKD